MIEIPETELMAEKLGMITLCVFCGKRIQKTTVARIRIWYHEDTSHSLCDPYDENEMRRARPSNFKIDDYT